MSALKTVQWQGPEVTGAGPEVWLIDQTPPPWRRSCALRQLPGGGAGDPHHAGQGAPAIGVSAAMGMALAAAGASESPPEFARTWRPDASWATRPTAVNLFWGIERMRRVAQEAGAVAQRGAERGAQRGGLPVLEVRRRMEQEALRIAQEDEESCRRIGEHGASLFGAGDGVLTHCNAGALACVDYGTALAPLRTAHARGTALHVYVDETRPFLQGSRLTAWELLRAVPAP